MAIIDDKELQHIMFAISHDFKAPLRHIREFTKLLLEDIEDTLTEEQCEYRRYIDRASNELESKIEGILKFSRVVTKTGNYINQSLEEPFQHALQQIIINKGEPDYLGEISVVEQPKQWPTLPIYPKLIEQLFVEILLNAREYQQPNIPCEISIRIKQEQQHYLFVVLDNGPGITSANPERAIELFYQEHKSANKSGVGLAVCKRIIQLHEGQFAIKNLLSQPGLQVSFTLPKTACH